jgi:SGNH hydrolase-like domain, acetyltransferase AlgX
MENRAGQMNSMKSERTARLLLILASLLFGWLLIELPALIRLVDYRAIIGPQHRYWATTKGDLDLLFIRRPYAHDFGTARGGDVANIASLPASAIGQYRWDVKYDYHGFRNASDLKKADLAVIGDSFVESPPTAEDRLMTSVLARLEGRAVVNLGQIGYGPQQELAVLRRYALPLHPSTVVWMFYEGNDLSDAQHYRDLLEARHSGPPRRSEYFQNLFARSFTNNVLVQLKHRLTPKPSAKTHVGVLSINGQPLTTYFLYHAHALTAAELTAVDMTAASLREAYQLCAGHGCRLVVAFLPQKFRVLRPFCTIPAESDCGDWVASDLPDRLRSVVQSISADAGFLDLTPSLQDAVKNGVMPYYRDDSHWSEEGHRVAAEAIDGYLRSLAINSPKPLESEVRPEAGR